MDTPVPSYPSVVRALCHAVVTDLSLRVAGPSTHYRCKATYSLYPAPLKVSELVKTDVNDLCQAVADFSTEGTSVPEFYQQHPRFLFEVCGKVTRKNEYMLKVVFLNEEDRCGGAAGETTSEPPTLFHWWYHCTEEPQRLFAFVKNRFPSLVTMVAHVRMVEGSSSLSHKPDKSCAYLPLSASVAERPSAPMSIVEYTPNGFSFLLSADSFCEVNQPMEDAIYHSIVDFLHLRCNDTDCSISGGLPGSPRRRAFICGRDVNSVVKTFEGFYEAVTVATTCPNVHADALKNGIAGVHLVTKDTIHELLSHTLTPVDAPLEAPLTGYDETHVLITAGRHGLHPSTTTQLSLLAEMHSQDGPGGRRHRPLTDIIYVSCNVESFARDLFILKQSLRVVHTRTFDFFPGTDYVMTVVHLQPIVPDDESLCRTGPGGLLVLPVGPPGSGKSTCARALTTFLNGKESDTSDHLSTATQQEPSGADSSKPPAGKAGKRHRGGNSPAPPSGKVFIPRTFANVASNIRVTVFERDRAFHELRETGKSLKQAKVLAHEGLLAALATPHCTHTSLPAEGTSVSCTGVPPLQSALPLHQRHVVYVDSTNGSQEARRLYTSLWARDAPCPCLTLWFDCPKDDAVLLERVAARSGHPCFPSSPEEQMAKIRTIQTAIEPSRTAEPKSEDLTAESVVHVDATKSVTSTVTQALVATCAFLLFAPELAIVYTPLAVDYLERQRQDDL